MAGPKATGYWVPAVLLAFLAAAPVWGQDARLAAEQGPHYVGEPFVMQIAASGFDEDPTPEVILGKAPEDLKVSFLGVNPSVSSSITIINGRRAESRRVVFHFNYRIIAMRAGDYQIPPATIKQGPKTATTNPLILAVQQIADDPDMRIELILPDAPIYPGQRAKVSIKWWYAGDVAEIDQLIIYSPLFDTFEFADEPVSRGDNALLVTGAKGKARVKAVLSTQTLGGKQYTVATTDRILLADQVGQYAFDPIVVNVSKITQWRRDVFGDRIAAAATRMRAVGKPAQLTVKQLPLAGRPQSFAGAIGSGFSLQVRAATTVVKLGDPITLTLTLRGDGRLSNASLPPLFADGTGLDPKRFSTPGGPIPGELTADGKQFEVSIRVTDATVSQIPPIAYSWFDPELGEYRTAMSAPVALQVGQTTVIGTQDVVSARPDVAADADEASPAIPDNDPRDGFDTSGADLAIVTDSEGLLVDVADRFGGMTTLAAVYGLSVLLLVVMFILGRRASVDPRVVAARRHIRKQIDRLRQAGTLAGGEQAAEIAAALRALAPHVKTDIRTELDRIVRECDDLTFAPSGPMNADGGDLRDRALALAKEVE